MMYKSPTPQDEFGRLMSLSEFDLDYSDLSSNFKDLTLLASKVAGTDISLVNLIDSSTQWTVASKGIEIDQMPREDSVCQYTIMGDDGFEVNNLSLDDRFKDKFYVVNGPKLQYYYGVPIHTDDGHNIGALCVMDKEEKILQPEKIELLKIISKEIVNRLNTFNIIKNLKQSLSEAKENQKRVAHDIRGPLGGIIGLAQLIKSQGDENTMDEVLEFISLIQKSGNSLLELADEILSAGKEQKLKEDEFNLQILKSKIIKLYTPQAYNKNINLLVNSNTETDKIPFSKEKLLQIIGNLISNALKFTPVGGTVHIELDLLQQNNSNTLKIIVKDNGIGMSEEAIKAIKNGSASSTDGTSGENGYGFGLALVKHLTDSLKGSLEIESALNKGTTFTITIPHR